MPTPETKCVLITIKAPPNPSKKYQETNCCAGIDLQSGQFVRLYPIPFRLLDNSKKFPKYSIIEVACQKPLRDKRVESYKVDQDNIKILGHLDTRNKWAKRKQIVLPTLSSSFCRILQDVKLNKSLGLFKPSTIQFFAKKVALSSQANHEAPYKQHWLFDKQLKPVEQIPFAFYYQFKCFNCPTCTGHTLSIHDWEITQSYSAWRSKYRDQTLLLRKIEQKWLEICSDKKDVYFYVGNMWQRPKQFMVLGVFYPPK